MKYIFLLLLLIVLAAGGYFAYTNFLQQPSAPRTEETSTATVEATNCLEGVNGNSGDNYCSNVHGSSSRCQPGFENNYPDGCTK